MSEIVKVFKVDEFCDKLIEIAREYKTEYNNKFPYNLGHYNRTIDGWSFDCWNLIKVLIWGWQPVRKENYYVYDAGKNGMGDWAGITILNKCDDISSDFSNIEAGEYLLTADGGHAGIYIGKHIIDGVEYNVAECTSAWGGGVMLTYVDSYGNRYRDGRKQSKISWWKHHAKLPWIDYTEEKEKEMEKELEKVKEEAWNKYRNLAQEIIDGKWGNNPQRKRSLNSCGYDYRFAQDIVNVICKWEK